MTTSMTPAEIRHDIEATFAARREMGPQYDEHFVAALAERLMRELHDAESRRRAAQRVPSATQRLILALASLMFGLPLIFIGAMAGHVVATALVLLTVLGINALFALLR
jgi:anti-sigma factor RsiW